MLGLRGITWIYKITKGGPCTWRPMEYATAGIVRPSCFDGFAKDGTKMVDQSRKGCSEAWIDELGIEHNPSKQPSTDEQINKVWAGSFALPMEYGKKNHYELLTNNVDLNYLLSL